MLLTFGEVFDIGVKRLEQASIADARRDAESLLLYHMKEDRSFLFLHKNDRIDEYATDAYFQLIDRRAEGEPLQYIVGNHEFMGLTFEVNPDVLIPRQDTESLVELAIYKAYELKPSLSILDMCTGSGAIAISMACSLKKSKVTACDLSARALEVAARNAEANGVGSRIKFIQSDMFEVTKHGKPVQIRGTFDMILSNPPYIRRDVIPTLQTEVKDHEPMMALDGGVDGLDFYRLLVRDGATHLKKGGHLIMEIGFDQGVEVSDLLELDGRYCDIEIHKDLAGLDRVVSCKRIK